MILALFAFVCAPDEAKMGEISCYGERVALWVNATREDLEDCQRSERAARSSQKCFVTYNNPDPDLIRKGNVVDFEPQLYTLDDDGRLDPGSFPNFYSLPDK